MAQRNPARKIPRLDMISRNFIRILRHPSKRREAPFPLLLAVDGSVLISEVLRRPTFMGLSVHHLGIEDIINTATHNGK